MTSIVLVDKNSSLKQSKVKNLTKDTLYRKCGFKVSGGFDLRTVWKVKNWGYQDEHRDVVKGPWKGWNREQV